tara:strand:+ start:181 stop:507 length:327 start_codon:yes stop_codon:yes gene_type:complete
MDNDISPKYQKYRQSVQKSEKLKIYSVNYKGKVIIPGSEETLLKSDKIQYKNNALELLKISALYRYPDCDVIVNVKYDTFPDNYGNYNYTAWEAKGNPARLNKKGRNR